MVIGIEASRANRAHRTGVEWYSAHLLRALHALPQSTLHAWILYTNTPLGEDLRCWTKGWTERALAWPPKYLWTQIRLSYEMRMMPPDVLFIPAHVLPRVLAKRTVVTVHDVGFKRLPHLYKAHQVAYHDIAMRDILASTAHILTVSEYSKQEIIALYGCAPERITVTPLGVEHATYKPATDAEQQLFRAKYTLGDEPVFTFIGRFEEKKNIRGLMEAFFAFAERSPKGVLVLVGQPGKGWNACLKTYRTHPAWERVRVLGYLKEEEKVVLLSLATALVHVSWYEGFGLPLLEAMACGALVIASNTTSLPEVAGDAAFALVPPDDREQITRALERVLALSPEERQDFAERGKQHAKRFTWKQTAELTYDVLTGYES